ncbi:MAG: hypothetical protein PHV34_08850 [Verrucomicrobiae bacterium]|nr:hypothetical protein [Verrucomicrobiae bacterium]
MSERPVKIDLIGSVWDAAWSIVVALSWLYLVLEGIRSFWRGNPNAGFSDPDATHGFRAPIWSRPSLASLLWNALVSGVILACIVGFLASCSVVAFWSTLAIWIAFRLILAALQVRHLSRCYRANPNSFRLLVDCMVKPGSRYAADIRRNGIVGDEWTKSPMRDSPEADETVFIVSSPAASCPDSVKAQRKREFFQADADAKALGFREIFDFAGYRLYWRMVTAEGMASDRQQHIAKWIEHLDGCGFTEEDFKRWHGYLNSVRQAWELRPYVPSIERDVDPFELDGEVSDDVLNRLADDGEKSIEGKRPFEYTVHDSGGAVKKGRLYAKDQAEAIELLREMGHFPTSLEEG